MARSKIGPALIAFFTVGIIWAFTQIPAYSSDLSSIVPATYKLHDGSDGICSMTLVKNDKNDVVFLTAAHCIGDKPEDNLGLNVRKMYLDKDMRTPLREEVFYLKAAKTIKKKDIALLKVKASDIQFDEAVVDIATVEEANSLKIGDDVIVAGYPAAEALSITKGTFAGKVAQVFSELDKDVPMYQTTVPLAGGNSGGGLYAEFDGTWKLIGTVTGKRNDNDVMTWMQTAETVQEALRGFVKIGDTAKAEPMPAENTHPGLRIDER